MRQRVREPLQGERAALGQGVPGAEVQPASGSIFSAMHRLLRGRYILAFLLGLAGAAGGGYLGWNSQEVLYRAEGLIQIAPSMPSPQDPAGMNVLPMFRGFVALQVQLLRAPTATHMAMDTDVWRDALRGRPPIDFEEFVERRAVEFEPDGQHIQVFFTDPSPDVAQAGVRALIQAYKRLSADQETSAASLESATTQAKLLEGFLKEDQARIIELSAIHGGVEGLAMHHMAAIEREIGAAQDLEKLRAAMAARETGQVGTAPFVPKSPREIAVEDPKLAEDLLQLELLQVEEELKSKTLGAEHDELVALRREIEVRKKHIDQRTEDVNQLRAGATPTVLPSTSIEDLKAREAGLEAHLESVRQESRRLGQIRVEIDRIQVEIADRTRRLEKLNALRDQLTAQTLVQGRISTPGDVERPAAPFRDRRVATAGIVGVLGGGVGVLLVLLLGFTDRRIRSTGDVSHALSRLRLLGLMPEFPKDMLDPEGGEIAAHCVHQIRTLLQIGHVGERGACLSVTGPGVGSGKTTLSLALGLSFAHASSRTVLVDADLTGRGLTRRVGQMLLAHARHVARSLERGRDGAKDGSRRPSAPRLHEGVDVPSGRSTGSERRNQRPLLASLAQPPVQQPLARPEDLVDLLRAAIEAVGLESVQASGLVQDLFAVSDLLLQGEGRGELADLLSGAAATGSAHEGASGVPAIPPRTLELTAEHPEFNGVGVERYLFPTGLGALRFLPLRGLGRAGGVSVSTLKGILERLRGECEVILVDTGPVPGAVEAPMVAACADSVVLVVSPGDHRPDAEEAVTHLEEVGAHLAGVVFNRAQAKDVLKKSRSQSSAPAEDPRV